MAPTRHLIAMGGGGFSMEPDNPLLDDYVLDLTRDRASAHPVPRVCFVSTASGDNPGYIARFYDAFRPKRCEPSHFDLFRPSDWTREPSEHLLSQDVLYFSGGSTFNALVLWRAWSLVDVLREAYRAGVIFTGLSAGAACWFESCLTDSTGRDSVPLAGLGWLPGSFCPHYDGEVHRRPTYQRLVERGHLTGGVAADDGAALHFENETLTRVVTSRPNARAYRVSSHVHQLREEELPVRYLGSPQP